MLLSVEDMKSPRSGELRMAFVYSSGKVVPFSTVCLQFEPWDRCWSGGGGICDGSWLLADRESHLRWGHRTAAHTQHMGKPWASPVLFPEWYVAETIGCMLILFAGLPSSLLQGYSHRLPSRTSQECPQPSRGAGIQEYVTRNPLPPSTSKFSTSVY